MTSETTPGITTIPDASTIELFQQDWLLYKRMVDNNYLFHRDAYQCLHDILLREHGGPFRFLDIACGDASSSLGALTGTSVAHYRGIDFSATALALAEKSVAELGCPAEFEQRDFVQALAGRADLADVIWVGLSLHHLRQPEKLAFMRDVRGSLAEGGVFMAYEEVSDEGESRDAWLGRWDDQESWWTAYTTDEWQALCRHVHAADFPEALSTWQTLGREAGFAAVEEVFVSPSRLIGLYRFST